MGTTEIVAIAGLGLVMFGPGRIPEFARQCGKAVSLFKNGMREALDDRDALEEEPEAPAKAPRRRERAR